MEIEYGYFKKTRKIPEDILWETMGNTNLYNLLIIITGRGDLISCTSEIYSEAAECERVPQESEFRLYL